MRTREPTFERKWKRIVGNNTVYLGTGNNIAYINRNGVDKLKKLAEQEIETAPFSLQELDDSMKMIEILITKMARFYGEMDRRRKLLKPSTLPKEL